MKSEIGLWIDHRQAVIVVVTDAGEETKEALLRAVQLFSFSDSRPARVHI